jgi:hypothetical protein
MNLKLPPEISQDSGAEIPAERKLAYYAGMILAGIGALMFVSVFFTAMSMVPDGPFTVTGGDPFDSPAKKFQSLPLRAIGGMALIVVGGILRSVGSKGLAGSGIVLDPEQARQDLEPWSRMGGGVVQDALAEVEVVQKIQDRLAAPEPTIKIRCQQCQALNDEASKFCNQCGEAI